MKRIVILSLAFLSACSSSPELAAYETPTAHLTHLLRTIGTIVGLIGILGWSLNWFYGQDWEKGGGAYVRHHLFIGMIVLAFAAGILAAIVDWI